MAHNQVTRQTVAAMVATGSSYRDVEAGTGVSKDTVARWMQDLEFRGMVEALQAGMKEAAMLRLQTLGPRAVEKVEQVMSEGDRDETQLRAALSILDRIGIVPGQALTVRAEQIDDTEVLGELAEAAGVGDVAQGDQEEPA